MMLLSLCTMLLVAATSGASARGRSSEERGSSPRDEKTPNVCDLSNESSVYCYCDNTDLGTAKEASCWAFSESRAEDPIWGLFASQPDIKKFKLLVRPDSSLRFIPTRALRSMRRLHSLDIQYASVVKIPRYAFANLSTLHELSLTRNQIQNLEPGAFAHLPSLFRLTLDENRIAMLGYGAFEGAPAIKHMYISTNNISAIAEGAFDHMGHMTELVLSRNALASISRGAFRGLTHLERLDLSENQLSELPEMAFAEMPALRELDLDRNGLMMVGETAFSGLPELERLSLGGNQLTALSTHALQGVPGLRVLDLRDNELRTLTRRTVEPMMTSLRNATAYLLLTGNLFECDCRLSWVHSLHNDTTSEAVRNALEELTCTLSGGSLPGGMTSEAMEAASNQVSRDGMGIIADDDEDDDDMENDSWPPAPPPAASLEPPTKHLLEISPELLPCPSEVVQTMPPLHNYAPAAASGVAPKTAALSRFSGALLMMALFTVW